MLRVGPVRSRLHWALLLWWLLATPAAAEVVLIANSGVPIKALNTQMALEVFSLNQEFWAPDLPIRVVSYRDSNSIHAAFCREILKIQPYQLQRAWERKLLAGHGRAPILVRSHEEMLMRVQETPGAIGYIDAATLRTLHTVQYIPWPAK